MHRRDILLGMGALAGVGIGEALRPRRHVPFFKGDRIAAIVPDAVPGFQLGPELPMVEAKEPGSLADRLYNSTTSKVFVAPDETVVMLLLAYGAQQSDSLQLHRPEVCYPAAGFAVQDQRFATLQLGGRMIPTVEMTATAPGRVEDIVYFSRLANFFPRTSSEQRRNRFQTALAGYIGDGVLVRVSAVRDGPEPRFAVLRQFLMSMVAAMPPQNRPALIGSDQGIV